MILSYAILQNEAKCKIDVHVIRRYFFNQNVVTLRGEWKVLLTIQLGYTNKWSDWHVPVFFLESYHLYKEQIDVDCSLEVTILFPSRPWKPVARRWRNTKYLFMTNTLKQVWSTNDLKENFEICYVVGWIMCWSVGSKSLG